MGVLGDRAGLGDLLEGLPLMGGVALHGLHEVRDEVAAALELHLDLRPGLVDRHIGADELVVHPDAHEHEHHEDGDDDDGDHDSAHTSTVPRHARGRPIGQHPGPGRENARVTVAIIGGGPGGYEAALVARQLGADVVLIHDGIGGSAVLTDCVPSKTLIATAEAATTAARSGELGVLVDGKRLERSHFSVDLGLVNARVMELAQAQSAGIRRSLEEAGVELIEGRGRLDGPGAVVAETPYGERRIEAATILVATGARPRTLPEAMPDGERILTWEQVYGLTRLPERLIVVGSGVTGAEFASAFDALGSDVTLVSSRDRVLPGEDPDAARVLEEVFARDGVTVLGRSRATAARTAGDGVVVTLSDGTELEGSHVLMAVGSLPNTEGIGLEEAGVATSASGFIAVDRVSRTSARGIYAAGDCTGTLMLASVAAMQGRIAMWHALGDSVAPLERELVSSTVFTEPEIATVGVTQAQVDSGEVRGDVVLLPLRTNARAKMHGHRDGFVKLICRRGSRIVAGAVIVAPNASELIHVVTLGMQEKTTADGLAKAFTVYPSLSGSLAEAARRLHG